MKIDLGSGFRKPEGYFGIDNREICKPDLVCNIENGLPFRDNKISEIRAHDVLEHIHQDKVILVMEDIWRVLKFGGIFDILVPSTDFNSRGAWQDPFHVSFWNKNSFWYYMKDEYRNLYNIKANFSGDINNIWTDIENKILHCHAILTKIEL